MVTLAISHNIHLNKEQGHNLLMGNSIEVVGVSVPVFYSNNKGRTNEPAREIFCNYILHNTQEIDEEVLIRMDGYDINLPQNPEDETKFFDNFREHVGKDPQPYNVKSLADNNSVSINFYRFGKTKIKDIRVSILHIIRIADMEELVNSLI